mgnify:FL=1
MDYNNILSKNNQNLDFIAEVESKNYQNSFPYPHIVLSNFFD